MKHKIGVVFLVAAFVLPSFASAQSVSDLQAQIAALLAQLQSLQQQLAVAQGTTTTQFCHTFTTNLGVGMSGPEVTALQTALGKDGESVTATGSFDDQTASAVVGFQEKYASEILTPSGLQHGTGYVGASTRAKLNALFGCSTNSGGLAISSLSPASGPVGTQITVNGTGFISGTTNTVNFGKGTIANLGSNGASINFTIPTYISPACPPGVYCTQVVTSVTPGVYDISVTNANGTSNSVSFTVTPPAGTYLNVLAPKGGEVLTSGTTYNIKYNSSYPQNNEPETGISLYQGNTLLGYPATTYISPDVFAWKVGQYTLNGAGPVVTAPPGSNYFIKVYMAGGLQAMSAAPFTISPVSNTGSPSITSLSPSAGPIGSSVTINGSGFSGSQNTVNFAGAHLTPNSVATDGSNLSFTVPGAINPSCYPQCLMPSGQVTSGPYSVSVTNANGTSNSVSFQVVPPPTSVGSLTVSQGAPIQGSVTPGQSSVLIGSYALGAGSSEGVSVSSVNISVDTQYFQNVKVLLNGVQLGTTWTQPTPGLSHAFVLASPVVIAAGSTATIQIFADVSASASSQTLAATTLTGCSASGMTSNMAIACNTLPGQGLRFVGAIGTIQVPSIASLSPMSGPIGTQVTVTGSGFTAGEAILSGANKVNFGSGVVSSLASNGASLTFTVPSLLQLNCPPGALCIQGGPSVTVGPYSVSVTNANGTSNSLSFQVTSVVTASVGQVQGLKLFTAGDGTTAGMSWSPASATNGVALYKVYRGTSSSFTANGTSFIGQTNTLGYNDANLSPGTYYYRVVAQDATGLAGAASDAASIVISAPLSGGGGVGGTGTGATSGGTTPIGGGPGTLCYWQPGAVQYTGQYVCQSVDLGGGGVPSPLQQ